MSKVAKQTLSKADLPKKICEACGRPFFWRKKWARVWDDVKTCSDRCKSELRRNRRVPVETHA